MARRDLQTTFSNAQAITASAASTNSLDLYDLGHRLGQAPRKLFATVECVQTFNNLTSLGIALQDSADDSSFAATEISGTYTLASNALNVGNVIMKVPLPDTGVSGTPAPSGYPFPGPNPIRRYIQLYYTVTGTAPTTGKVTAFIETY